MNLIAWRRDWVFVLAFFLLSLVLRVPFRSEYAYHWDSAQFALAIEHYDLRLGLPHPPGFFLYVMLGRLVNGVVGDPHASLVWISVVAGSVLAALGYLLGKLMFGQKCGVLAGVILATSPLTWFHSEIALTTIVDSALVTATALVCWLVAMRRTGWRTWVGLGVLLAVVAGTRGQSAPVLLPLWVYALWRQPEKRWPRLGVAVFAAAVATLVWFVPMVQMSGGWEMYRQALAAKTVLDRRFVVWGTGWPALQDNLFVLTGAVGLGLGVAGVIGLAEFGLAVVRRELRLREPWQFLLVWVGTAVVVGVGVLYTFMPGHVLNYFPALVIAVAAGIQRAGERLQVSPIWFGIVVAVGGGGFFLTNLVPMGGAWRRLEMNATEIRRHDGELDRCFAFIRAQYRPEDVVICHDAQWYLWGLRHFQYHLPEYENWLLVPDKGLPDPGKSKLWRTTGRQVEFVDEFKLPAGKRVLLVRMPESGGSGFRRFRGFDRVKSFCLGTGIELQEVVDSKE